MIRPALVPLPALLLAACATPHETSTPQGPVTVGIIAFNDFHGNLEPPGQAVSVPDGRGGRASLPAGGAAWLASAIEAVREGYEHHVTVSAGDLIGASPLTSAIFVDEPTIGVMNRIGLDFNAVGNHEFDSGTAELRRKQDGGCGTFTSRKPCALEPFAGAMFRFLAANVKLKDGGGTLFPATALKSFGGATIGFIGMTLEETGSLVSASGISDVTFADEAATANALAPELKEQGADAIVLLIHEGGEQGHASDPNGCEGFTGAIREIAARLDPAIDVIVSGHTHRAYICKGGQIGVERPLLLTSAGASGTLLTEISLTIDPASHRLVSGQAVNRVVKSAEIAGSQGTAPVDPAFANRRPRADIAALVSRYAEAARPIAARSIGKLSGPASRSEDGMGGTLGNLVADAQLAATRSDGAQIAFTNPFGLRAPLLPDESGRVNYGAVFATQPFGNMLVTLELTGAQIKAALEQGFDNIGREQVLAASEGFAWSYDRNRQVGDRVAAMTLQGKPIDPAKHYRVTVNTFLAGGGDDFSVFTEGRAAAPIRIGDLEALERWIAGVPVRQVPTESRAVALIR